MSADSLLKLLGGHDEPTSIQARLEKLWRAACRVCDQILDYRPDLVLALMHSGWGPVFAASVLWERTQSGPFPAVARSNLGREKISLFEETFSLRSGSFYGEYASDLDVGRMLAWVTTRTDWRE